MNDDVRLEQSILRRSVWAGVFQSIFGLGFFFIMSSQAIMLDGFFSLVAVGVDLLVIRVAGLVSQPDDRSFQFGYGIFEPMLNLGSKSINRYKSVDHSICSRFAPCFSRRHGDSCLSAQRRRQSVDALPWATGCDRRFRYIRITGNEPFV